jgi:hypothetical protein
MQNNIKGIRLSATVTLLLAVASSAKIDTKPTFV